MTEDFNRRIRKGLEKETSRIPEGKASRDLERRLDKGSYSFGYYLLEDKTNYLKAELQQKYDFREKYFPRTMWTVWIWLGFVLVIIFVNGWSKIDDFSLSSGIVIALIGSVPAIVGLFTLIAKWLFQESNYPKK